LEGRLALITGAGQVTAGARVIATDVNESTVEAAAPLISSQRNFL